MQGCHNLDFRNNNEEMVEHIAMRRQAGGLEIEHSCAMAEVPTIPERKS